MKILILGSLSTRDSTIEGTIIRVPYENPYFGVLI